MQLVIAFSILYLLQSDKSSPDIVIETRTCLIRLNSLNKGIKSSEYSLLSDFLYN